MDGTLSTSARAYSSETNNATEISVPVERVLTLEKSRTFAATGISASSRVSTEQRRETYRDWTTNFGATEQKKEPFFAHSTDSSVLLKPRTERIRTTTRVWQPANSSNVVQQPEQKMGMDRIPTTSATVLPEQKESSRRPSPSRIKSISNATVDDTTALSISQLTVKPDDVHTFVLDCT